MKEYKYVRIAGQGWSSTRFEEHREIISQYAANGYRFVGFVPTKIKGYGYIAEIDLIFERDEP